MKVKSKKKSEIVRDKKLRNAVKSKNKLNDTTESTVHKAVKNVKKILGKTDSIKKQKVEKAEKEVTESISSHDNDSKKKKKKVTTDRGVIIVSHIPHGFYEEQMKDYFSQFGKVTRVRVARSRKTGQSRGYGYVEFLHPEVGKIAAETMNNYLMSNRLLKVSFIPPEKQHNRYFIGKAWSTEMYPALKRKREIAKHMNSLTSDVADKKNANKSLKRLRVLEKKLKAKGISMKFQPNDVPT